MVTVRIRDIRTLAQLKMARKIFSDSAITRFTHKTAEDTVKKLKSIVPNKNTPNSYTGRVNKSIGIKKRRLGASVRIGKYKDIFSYIDRGTRRHSQSKPMFIPLNKKAFFAYQPKSGDSSGGEGGSKLKYGVDYVLKTSRAGIKAAHYSKEAKMYGKRKWAGRINKHARLLGKESWKIFPWAMK